MNGVLSDLPVSGAKCVGDPDINAAAHADQQSREQRHQQRGGNPTNNVTSSVVEPTAPSAL